MNKALNLEDILAIARAATNWSQNTKTTYGLEYSGVYIPAGSDKEVIVTVSHYRSVEYTWYAPVSGHYVHHYQGSMNCAETEIAQLNGKVANRVFDIAQNTFNFKKNEEANAEQRKWDEKKHAVIGEIKQALKGDSRLSTNSRLWYRRLFG